MSGLVSGALKTIGKAGVLKSAKAFFFGSKLRTALTLGTGALVATNRSRGGVGMYPGMGMGMYPGMGMHPGSMAMANPAMAQMMMYRGF